MKNAVIVIYKLYQPQILWFLEAMMIGCAIVGSTILAMNVDISKFGYVFFTLSSVSGIYVGVKRSVLSLTLLNLYFTIVNMVGVFRWVF